MLSCAAISLITFQSTRPRGRTRLSFEPKKRVSFSFNPRVLAGGRDSDAAGVVPADAVSIHASSREDATSQVSAKIT